MVTDAIEAVISPAGVYRLDYNKGDKKGYIPNDGDIFLW
jgi:hypothetical protein